MSNPPEVLDGFAGPGGWSEALRTLGLRDLGIELDASACATRAAAGHATVRADVSQLDAGRLAGFRGHAWSPPCITYSAAGNRAGMVLMEILAATVRDLFSGRDTRRERRREMGRVLHAATPMRPTTGRRAHRIAAAVRSAALVAEPARFIHACHPEWVALEQVPAVLPLWRAYTAELRALGYSAWCGKLNAADYGVPQTRVRAILIASRVRRVTCPEPTHYDPRKGDQLWGEPWVSMAEALGFGANAKPAPSVTAGGTSTGGAEPFPTRARNFLAGERDAGRWVSMANAIGLTNEPGEPSSPATEGSPQRQWLLADAGKRPADICPPVGVGAGQRPDPTGVGSGSPVPGEVVLQPGSHGTSDEQGEYPPGNGHVGNSRPENRVPEGSPIQDQGRRQAVLPDLQPGERASARPTKGHDLHEGQGCMPEGAPVHAREHGVLPAGPRGEVAGQALPDLPAAANAGLQGPQESGASRLTEPTQWMLRRSRGEGMLEREGRGGRRDHPLDEPAPAITSAGGKDGANLSWVLHTNRGQAEDGTRQTADPHSAPAPAPAPALTAKSGGQWKVKLRNNNNNACERSLDEPAGTLFFGHRSNWAAWVAERPATTVCGRGELGRPGHKDRSSGGESHFAVDSVRITVQEAAILQSFRPDYPWQGTKTKQFEQVGNAMPPLLAEHVIAMAAGIRRNEAAA